MARDPVCGMEVDSSRAAATLEHAGLTYYFCHPGCKTKFIANPSHYLQPVAAAATTIQFNRSVSTPPAAPAPVSNTASGDVEYTCPMDSEVRQRGPGICPKCGMALDPVIATPGALDDTELRDMTRRFVIATAFALPLLLLAMTRMSAAPGALFGIASVTWNIVEGLLATAVMFWAGCPLLERGWQSLRTRNLNMFTLVSLGVATAYIYSIAAALLPGWFPAGFRQHGGELAVYFEAAAVIVALVLLGQVLELRARQGTAGAIQALLGLVASTARRRRADGMDEEVPFAHV